MSLPTEANPSRWPAELYLRFARQRDRTLLVENRHKGPLVVQKALYPEGGDICHAVIVHPPGGVAGGDDLKIGIELNPESRVVLTTPAATKWYKSLHYQSAQKVELRLAKGCSLDWLPQENIYFNAAAVDTVFRLEIEEGATAIGWEMAVLGRAASAEAWLHGCIRALISISVPGKNCLWTERMVLEASSPLRSALQGTDGCNVFGTLWAIGCGDLAMIAEELAPGMPYENGLRAGVTSLPGGILLIRALAHQVEPLRHLLIQSWRALRPKIHGFSAQPLRLWAT